MYRAFFVVLLAGLSLSAQVFPEAARLYPSLSRVLTNGAGTDDAARVSLIGAMMSVSPAGHQAGRQQVIGLVSALRGVMAGREIDSAQLLVLSRCISDVLRGQGGSNFTLAAQLRQELTALRVGDQRTDLIVKRFIALGETVRGPDDTPVFDESISK